MERMIKLLLVIASLMTVELTVTESKDNENKKKIRVERPYYHPALTNVCDIVDRRSKVHCYCDSTKQKMATWADCWVFSGELTEDDSIWPSFSTQPNIEHLIFNVRTDDALTFIPAKALIRLGHLKHLTIQFGSIRNIPAFAFNNSTNIRQIALKSNRITNLEVNSFSKLMMLTNLSLEDNLISELQRDVFVGLPNLHILHLTSNNLSLIHEGCFRHLNNLIELKLDSNYISVVTRETFEGLQNLARLDLRNNKMTMIGNLAFSELWGLKELLLDNNAIEYISERSFGGLTQMTKLSLSGNKLTAFYEDIIEEIRSLLVLDLSDNLLDTISYETIRSIVENEKSSATALYLDGNPLTCDCRLAWIYLLRNATEDNTLRAALEKVSCITDPTIAKRLKDTDKDKTKAAEDYYYEEKASDNNILYDEPKRNGLTSAMTLSDIPLKILPCPKELLQSLDKSHQHPVQNEIRLKAFSNGDRPFVRAISILFVAVLIFVSSQLS